MTPNQALDLLDKIAAQYHGSRQDHINLQAALKVLTELVDKKPKKS